VNQICGDKNRKVSISKINGTTTKEILDIVEDRILVKKLL